MATAKEPENTQQPEEEQEFVPEVGIIVYSDQPGAGPDDVPEEDEEEGKPKKKAVAGPPSNKALAKPEGNK